MKHACLPALVTAISTATGAASDVPDLSLGPLALLSFYGQFHFANQDFDDGVTTTSNIVDITNANSRVGFYIRSVDDAFPLLFHFESGLGFRPSSKTSQTVTPMFWDWSREDLRKVQFILETEAGEFRLGQGSMPADGAAEADLGGTVVVAKSTIPESTGSYELRTAQGDLSGIVIGDTFDNFDGDRRFRFRWDSPEFYNFSLAAAYGIEVLKSGVDDTYYDVSLRYERGFSDFRVKGAVGVANARKGTETDRVTIGSVSVLHEATGLNLSVAGGHERGGGKYVYLKGGWNARLWDIGTTKFVTEVFRGTDYVTNGAKSDMWSVGIIQDLDDQSLELYAGYKAFSYDDLSDTRYRDASAVQIGARFRY